MAKTRKSKVKSPTTPSAGEAAPTSIRRRRIRGSLKDMPNLPLDVLFEIFCQMEPMDLLNLARTSKDFRAVLMSRSSASFWKAARRNMKDMPECPSFLSEPAYANLAFDPHCHHCLKPRVKYVDWKLRVRYCDDCRDQQLVKAESLYLVPCVNNGMSFICSRAEYNQAQSVIHSLNSDDEIKKYKQKRKALVLKIEEFSRACEKWYDHFERSKEIAREKELERLRADRLKEILQRLRGLGWGEEVDAMPGWELELLCRNGGVKRAEKLTELAWSRMKARMEREMQQIRQRRIAILVCKRVSSLEVAWLEYQAKAPDQVFPPVTKLVAFEELRRVLVASKKEVPLEHLSGTLKPIIPALLSTWRQQADEELVAMIRKDVMIPSRISDPKALAVAALYHCLHCGMPLVYPHVLSHSCGSLRHSKEYGDFLDEFKIALVDRPCSFGVDVASDILSPIIKAYGMDPKKATIKDMDNARVRLSCANNCCQHAGVESILSWRAAMTHFKRSYSGKRSWSRAHVDDWDAVKKLEETALARATSQRATMQRCAHCIPRAKNFSLSDHLKLRHQIETPGELDTIASEQCLELQAVYMIDLAYPKELLPAYVKRALKDGTAMFKKTPT